MKHIRSILLPAIAGTLLLLALGSCMKWDYGSEEDFDSRASGIFVLNEGNFQYGNASLSFYDPATRQVENEIFYRANGMRLGDVAQSLTLYGGRGWVVVNNSHVIFAFDLSNYRETGRITGLTSPRYIHFVSDRKAYVTQLWDNRIAVIDPQTYSVTSYIEVDGMDSETASTEQMVSLGRYVYVSCWSYQDEVLKIDSETDRIVGRVTVGLQPRSLVVDRYGRLWTLCDGGYEGSPTGSGQPTLHCIEPETMTVLESFSFRKSDRVAGLCLNGAGDRLYWINDGVWSMSVDARRLPVRPVIKGGETLFYSMAVDPVSGEIYVADAIDYQQPGVISRYTADGVLVDSFEAGINPTQMVWCDAADYQTLNMSKP